jgi:CarD family transcriptional regulator
VPTHKATEIGMRQLSSPDVVTKALDTLKGRAKVKRAMWSRRAQEYEQKINSGDLLSIAEVVRDLHRTDDQREQSYSERQLYEAALERLTREVAAVSGVDEAGAAKTVDEVLVSRAA